jgi:hypothetical protein
MFSPPNTTLTTVHEDESFRVGIAYVADTTPTYGATGIGVSTGGQSYPVTITTNMPNSTVNISNNTISGNFTGAFNNTISYRTVDDKFITVSKWQQIADAVVNKTLSELYYYRADPRPRIVYNYIATANGHSQTYYINVDNDWMTGRNKLIKNTHFDRYQQKILVEWINNNTATIPWLAETLTSLDWENENL